MGAEKLAEIGVLWAGQGAITVTTRDGPSARVRGASTLSGSRRAASQRPCSRRRGGHEGERREKEGTFAVFELSPR